MKEKIQNLKKISEEMLKEIEAIVLQFQSTGSTGDYSTGNCSTGNRSTGDYSTGNRSTGDYSTGNRSTGDCSTGYSSTGDYSTGNRSTGDWSTGYSSTGDWSTGDYSTGDFCTVDYMGLSMFNKPCTLDQYRCDKPAWLYFALTEWIPLSSMTAQEKIVNPHYETTQGYLKVIPFKEAAQNAWNNAPDEQKEATYKLPNFDADVFYELFGIRVACSK
jgi:hypothetical protein